MLRNPHLLGTPREPILRFHLGSVIPGSLQPFDMVVNRVADRNACRKRFEKLFCQAFRPLEAGLNVVTLLKIDVLKKIAPDRSCRNRVPKHFDSGKVRNRTFNRHQALAQNASWILRVWTFIGTYHGNGFRGPGQLRVGDLKVF